MSQTEPASASEVFEIEKETDTIIVIPVVDLRELDYERIEKGAKAILELLNGAEIKNVVLDFHRTDYFGSTAIGLFMKVWKRVSSKKGRMALCNISDHEKEILEIMQLDDFWQIRSSRIEALKAVID